MTISPKRTLSAFRIISIALFLDFPFNSRECLRLAWNTTLGGFASKCRPRNSPYAFSPTTFAFNRYPCALLVVKHTRYYCSVLNGFIQLLFSKAISDFTSAPSLFAILVLLRSVCSELDLFRSTRSLGCLKKYFDLQQLLLKIIPRIILANCSYFKAKDCGTLCCPLSFRLLTWLQLEPYQKAKGLGHRSWPKIHQTSDNHRPPDGSPRCGTSQRRILVNSRRNLRYRGQSTKAVTIQWQINVVANWCPSNWFLYTYYNSKLGKRNAMTITILYRHYLHVIC